MLFDGGTSELFQIPVYISSTWLFAFLPHSTLGAEAFYKVIYNDDPNLTPAVIGAA